MLSLVLFIAGVAASTQPAAIQSDGHHIVQAQSDDRRFGRRWRDRRGEGQEQGRRRGTDEAVVARAQRLTYGRDDRQRVLFWPGRSAPLSSGRRPPLAVYVHGGGWAHGQPEMVSEKPAFFNGHGWAFASVGYRLLPDAPVEEQAADIGRAIRLLRAQAAALGYDPDRILLFGHSAGAHLAALVASDPTYAGDAFAAIRGVIPVDGACYDVPAQIALGGFMVQRTYVPAFGTDPARQRALSPIAHAGGRDAPDWLLLHTSARDDAAAQSRALADALRRGGSRVQQVEVPARSNRQLMAHMEINRDFGVPGYAANDAVLAMMRRIETAQ